MDSYLSNNDINTNTNVNHVLPHCYISDNNNSSSSNNNNNNMMTTPGRTSFTTAVTLSSEDKDERIKHQNNMMRKTFRNRNLLSISGVNTASRRRASSNFTKLSLDDIQS